MSGAGAAGTDDEPDPVVVVRVGPLRIGLPVAATRAVVRPEGITPLRDPSGRSTPGALVGMVAVHGRVAAVVDPRPALGLAPLTAGEYLSGDAAGGDRQQLLVVADPLGRFALLVDEVDGVTPDVDASVRRVEVADLVAGVVAAPEPADPEQGVGP